jgi:hypothetical protein
MLVRIVVCAGLAAAPALADSVSLNPDRDNTIYEDSAGGLSNALGPRMFVGRNAMNQARRALLHFDVAAAIPAGSTITSATVVLNLSQTVSGDTPVSLYRALANWGEGTSNAGDPGGAGAPATPGDATWLHTFWAAQFWSGPGGVPGVDFAAAASASTTVGAALGPYAWASSPGLVSDVQGWLDQPSSNEGWFLIGDESAPGTAKRFDTRENAVLASRPALRLTFTPPAPCYANCDLSTQPPCLNILDFSCFLNHFAAGDAYANCDGSTQVPTLNVLDFACFLNRFAAGCSGC